MGKSLGIILPALNEKGNVEHVVDNLINYLVEHNVPFHMVLINDGSSDGTREIYEQYRNREFVTIIHHEKPQNIGACYLEGYKLLETDYVTWMPTDGEIDISTYDAIIPNLQSNKAILTYPGTKISRNPLRTFLSITYQKMIQLIFGLNIKYFNGNCFFPREVLQGHDFISKGFTINAELVIYALKVKKMEYVEVPFVISQRMSGHAKALRPKNIYNVVKSLAQIYWKY